MLFVLYPGHKLSNCDKKKGRWLSICKNKSHFTNKCCKKKDSTNKTAAANGDDHSLVFKINDENMNVKASHNTFFVACGATMHIVNAKDHYIELADGTMINDVAKQRGTILTQSKTKDGVYVDVKLSNVLLVPDFPQSIFSVKSATSQGCKVNFFENNDELIAPNRTVFSNLSRGLSLLPL